MTLTAQHLERVLRAVPGAYGRQVASLADLAAGANEALADSPGLTVQGAAAFLATMAQESASFRTTQEYHPQERYKPFTGRTFEQITWESNYRGFGQWCHDLGLLEDPEAFVKKPTSLADLRWAWLGGVWFWQAKGIWAYGNRGDFDATQKAVNLGNPAARALPNGIADRRKWYAAWLALGDALLPTPPAPPAPDTKGLPAMAANAKQVYRRFTTDQTFTDPGQHQLQVDSKKPGDTSLAVGPKAAAGVNVGAVITSERGGVLRLLLVDYAKDTPTVVHHQRVGQSFPPGARVEVTASFAGSIGKAATAGHDLRLRAAVESAGAVTVHDVQSTGYVTAD